MSADDTIRILLDRGCAGGDALDPAEWRCVAARTAWVREIIRALSRAQRAMDERCMRAVGELDDAAFSRLFDAEQAKVDAIRAQIDDVIEHDRWPKHLYFDGV
jgi:hypothetical protein